jgi:isopentenyl diphosphate isomerase/L-lactate dehydrogenase-like FMN-dependent dehydrogenase
MSIETTATLEHGVAAVWISNHGGRQLDCSRGTLDVLPEVARAVERRVPSSSTASGLAGDSLI